MKKIVIFASCERTYQELKNVYEYLYDKQCKVIFLYTKEKETLFPNERSIHKFTIESNFELNQDDFTHKFSSIGSYLPFIPDALLVGRESWLPETRLITEFKQLGSLVYCIENSSWLYNNIKTRLEILSRFRFPTNLIDIFFDHSSWTFQTKKEAGWVRHKSIITGIPKFDTIVNNSVNGESKYIIVYGSMENNIRPNIINTLKEIKESDISNQYKICYRPHPKEFSDYTEDFENRNTNFFKDVIVIDNESDLQNYVKDSYCNIGIFSSVMLYPILMGKNILYLNQDDSGVMQDMYFENFEGDEFDFWKNIIDVQTFEDFKNKVGVDRVDNFIVRYNSMIDAFKFTTRPYTKENIYLLDNQPVDYSELSIYFDEYSDGNASKRVGDFILQTYI